MDRVVLRLLAACLSQRPPEFQLRSGHVGFVVDKVTLGYFFSGCFGFPYQFSFYKMLHIHLSFGAGIIGQLVAVIPSELRLKPHLSRGTFILVGPTWSIGHQRKASFHFSFLILDVRQGSLNGVSARRKAATYAEHKHGINADNP
jgi:hypothetical protein